MKGTAPGIAGVPAHRHEKKLRWFSLALIAAVLIAAFVLPLININRYHRTISETLARSIGHPVHLGSVKLQLLPRPGLAISDFVVDENPDFGAEPLLRSPSVVVSVRLTSLWRGRLEVSRIDLDEASVNLVRNTAGQWNFASVLEQASRIPNAPTAQRRSSGNPRFPYIQFKSARINFKSGNEKKGFAFLNSKLSIWLDNPQQWRLRFEAQPMRTDLALDAEDTGLLRVEGSLDRAPALEQMSMKLHAEWVRAEIGQASRMIFASDQGWRGDLRIEGDLDGPLEDLHLATRLRVADAHRQEFTPLTPLNVDARCRAEYHHTAQTLQGLTCLWPVGDGHLLLTGNFQRLSSPEAQLTLEINQTPASFAMSLLGLLRAALPSSLTAKGLINGSFTYATTSPQRLAGQATVEPLSLSLSDGAAPIVLPELHFTTSAPAPAPGPPRKTRGTPAKPAPPSGAIFIGATANLGAPAPLQISGQLLLSGFSLRVAGQSSMARLKELTSAFSALRASTSHLAPQGLSEMDLTFSGPWLPETVMISDTLSGPAPASIQGWLRLKNAQVRFDWLPQPVQIASIGASFADDGVRWSNANVSMNGIAVHGSADAALRCASAKPCPMHFSLDVPSLDAAALQSALLGAGRHGELLTTILQGVGSTSTPWPAMSGQAHIGSFTLGSLTLENVRSSLSVEDHRLEISSLDAATLSGSVHATGAIDILGAQPQYTLQTDWSGIDVSAVAGVFEEEWPAVGQMDGGTHLALHGYSLADLTSSAKGTFHWTWRNGSLVASTSVGATKSMTPARFSNWSASGSVTDSVLTLNKSGAANPVSGTISFDRKLDLQWPGATASTPVHIGGTLAQPVVAAPQTAAK